MASVEHSKRSGPVVCLATTVHSPFDVRIFHKECISLVRAGYEVHLIACHDRDEVVQGVHIHALRSPSNRILRMFLWPILVCRVLLRIRPRPRICHFYDPELLPLAMILRLMGMSVILALHEDVYGQILTKYWIPAPIRFPVACAYRIVETFCTMSVGIIESDMIEGRFRQPKQSVRNLPIIGGRRVAPRALGAFTGKPVLIYAGGIVVNRGAFDMLHLAIELRDRGIDFEMQIVGGVSSPELFEDMRKFVSAQGLSEFITMTGKVPFPESLRLISEATIGLSLLHSIPNYMYALPTKILEYMIYGLPVVASNLPCSAAYVRSCNAGVLVPPGEPEQAAAVITELLADPGRMLEYSTNGQESIARGLNWEAESELLLRFYLRMLGHPLVPDACTPHRRRGQTFEAAH